ncbi:MAG: hypothetical protein ABWY45_09900 [Mycobacterium sp.]
MSSARAVITVKSLTIAEDLEIPPGTSGTVVDSTLLGTPKRVRFVLHSDAGRREVTADVRRGDVA